MKKDRHLLAIGAHIRALREARGFTQEGLAAAVGIDRAYYGGVERGERNVAARNLVRIALVLGVEVGALFPPVDQLADHRRSHEPGQGET